MTLYILNSNQFSNLFGTPENNLPKNDVTIIGQNADCSQFLVLSGTAYPQLILQNTIPIGFIFTYCQEWGLTINDDIIRKVKKDIRSKNIEKLTITTLSGKIFDANETAVIRMTSTITGMEAGVIASVMWTLADNTRVLVSLSELKEALVLSGQAQMALWAL